MIDAKDHPGYNPTVEVGMIDAKDHPGYNPTVEVGMIDAKDHPGYNPTVEVGMIDAKDHPGYNPTVEIGMIDAKDHPDYNPTVEAGMIDARRSQLSSSSNLRDSSVPPMRSWEQRPPPPAADALCAAAAIECLLSRARHAPTLGVSAGVTWLATICVDCAQRHPWDHDSSSRSLRDAGITHCRGVTSL